MSYGNYVYTSDKGDDYYVTVPTDFAAALGMVAATTQPALDPVILPRFANCRSNTGLVRSAVIQDLSTFNSLPGTTIIVSGITYTWLSFQGESIPRQEPLIIQAAAIGPQGPPGASASIDISVTQQPSDVLVAFSGPYDLVSANLLAGSHIITVCVREEGTSSTPSVAVLIINDTTAGKQILQEEMFTNESAGNVTHTATFLYKSTVDFTLQVQANSISGSPFYAKAFDSVNATPVGISDALLGT